MIARIQHLFLKRRYKTYNILFTNTVTNISYITKQRASIKRGYIILVNNCFLIYLQGAFFD
jgi:hypothetical protein